jgi:YVTN family beta-propeller protein
MSFSSPTLNRSRALLQRSWRALSGYAVVALLFVPASVLAQASNETGFVFTADERGSSISRADLATGIVTTVAVTVAPHNVQISADGHRLLIVGAPADPAHGAGHGHAGGAGRLLVLDPRALNEPTAQIEVGDHPAHVVTDLQGLRAFVSNAGDDTLSVVDLDTGSLVATISTGDYPHGLRLSPDGRYLMVANVESGSVSLIDVQSLAEVNRVAVGAAPVQVAFLPDGSRAYVSLRDEDAVSVIDLASLKVIGRIPVGDGPIQLHATPDGTKIFVANQGSETAPSSEVSVIDVASSSVVVTITAGLGAHGVSISTDGSLVFVTNVEDGSLTVIDAATYEVLATHIVGSGPNGVTYLDR